MGIISLVYRELYIYVGTLSRFLETSGGINLLEWNHKEDIHYSGLYEVSNIIGLQFYYHC